MPNHRANLRLAFVAAMGLTFVGCSSCSRPTAAGFDAPSDTSYPTVDGGVSDALVSAQDTGVDHDLPPPAPGWTRLPFLRDCDVAVATNAASMIPPLRWIPCPNNRAGCLQLAADWAAPGLEGAAGMAARVTPAGIFVTVLQLGLPSDRYRIVLAPIDGAPYLAFEAVDTRRSSFQPHCEIYLAPPGPDTAAVWIARYPALNVAEDFFLAGPFYDDPLWRVPAAHVRPNEYGPVIWGEPQLAGRSFVLGTDGVLFRSDPTTATLQRIATDAEFGAEVCCARALADATLFGTGSARTSTWIKIDNRAPVRLFQPPPGTDAVPFYTDGRVFYWFEGHGPRGDGSFTEVDLWTSPLSTTPEGIVPRRVSGTNLHGYPVANLTVDGGRMGYSPGIEGDGYRIVNPDGTWWALQADPGMDIHRAIYMTETELGILVTSQTRARFAIVQRLRFEALGPPRPPIP